MGKETLITGAAGFSGSHQVDKNLALGNSVVGLVRETSSLVNLAEAQSSQRFTLAKLDLTSPDEVLEAIKTYKPRSIIHLAALSNVTEAMKNSQFTLKNNLLSTLNILSAVAMVSPDSTVVLTGSSHEFGIPGKECPGGIDEMISLNPQNPYAQSKVLENIFIESFTKQHGLKIVKARVFNHSGPRRHDTSLDGKLVKDAAQAKINRSKWLVTVGNKDYSRDWQHVHNWNNANIVLASSGKTGETYNVASGQPHSIEEFIDSVAQTLGVQFEITENPDLSRPGDPLKTFANNNKLRSLGWTPEKSFEDMINDCSEYWMNKLK